MTPAEAQRLIETLAEGLDPDTGETVPADSPLHNPRVIRALFVAARALESRGVRRERPRLAEASHAGRAWSETEERQLAEAFDAGTAVATLAETHQRTTGAITSRLIRLGRLQPELDTSS